MLGDGLASILATIGPLLVVTALAVIAGAAVQGGIHFKKFEGKYEQFNIVHGHRAGLRHPGTLGGRQDPPEDRGRRRSCSTS